MSSQVIPLGAPGAKRYFAPAADTTARHDGWLMVQLADAGVTRFAGKELTEHTATELVVEVLRSGKWELILAGMLVEQDVPWTPENAAANAEWFASLTDTESKQALRNLFLPTLAGFFLGAMPSLGRSPSVSVTRTTSASPTPENGASPSIAFEAPALEASGSDVPGS
jgi:hypothetical protein